tara:strand:- start:1068 stop:1454 length:387 start_codon:yes stop_codon:yes gene_type:complete
LDDIDDRIVELASAVHTLLKGQRHLFAAIDHLKDDRDKLIDLVKMLVPKYYTGLYTFDNESEAEMAWTLLQMRLHPNDPVPPMPRGPAYTCPYDHVGECPGHGHRVPLPNQRSARNPESITEKYGGEL